MDGTTFDELARGWSTATAGRRGALLAVVGGAVAAMRGHRAHAKKVTCPPECASEPDRAEADCNARGGNCHAKLGMCQLIEGGCSVGYDCVGNCR
jgi:hypothetical protein